MFEFWSSLTAFGRFLVLLFLALLVATWILALAPVAHCQSNCMLTCHNGQCAYPCVCVMTPDGEGVCVRR